VSPRRRAALGAGCCRSRQCEPHPQSRNGRDSNPKYLGVKIFGGQAIDAGNIIQDE